ncbi:MAG: Vitamin B12 dependent methionine synthase activation subunit [Clostridia bacterium]|nr:Vitamin B12 dependent methionine synthase activation subunit [Clostridia bacterium]
MRDILKETLRYLGYGKAEPDEATLALIVRAGEELSAAVKERITLLELPVCVEDNRVQAGSAEFKSEKLSAHLSGCERCVLLCATLGAGVDRLLARASAREMGYAAVLNAAASAWIEEFLDEWQAGYAKEHPEYGLVSRFSPGYGDWDIACQRELLNLLSAWRIGVTATESSMLVPVKSVTALLGLKPGGCGTEYASRDCSKCNKLDCNFRKETI